MITLVQDYFYALLTMLAEMAPYLMLGFFIAGILHSFVPRKVYAKHLAPRNMKSVVTAAAVGIPLPLCSCGVIPTSVSLRREGASHGACTSFLIATPQTGVDSIAATYSMMGLPFAIVRPLAALFTALFGGWLVNRFARGDEDISALSAKGQEPDEGGMDEGCDEGCCSCQHDSSDYHARCFRSRLHEALKYGFVEMLQDVGKWLVMGLLIAALITVAIPNEWLAALHDYKLLNMLIVLAIAIPMYVCATGSIPIAVSLMAKGLTPGAALVLLMAGPAVNSASILVIGNAFGKRTLSLYLLAIVLGSMLFGLCIDYLLPQEWFAVNSLMCGACKHALSVWQWLCVGVFVSLLTHAFVLQGLHSRRLKQGHRHLEESSTQKKEDNMTRTYKIDGMSCNHCKASAEKAIRGVDGVVHAEVDLAEGKAYVEGHHDDKDIIAAVEEAGFSCKSLE